MTAENATNDFDDELLSAYVDGELTAAERARVEERLRSDPAAAALVEELRSLSSEIQRLPREPLGRDLRAGVLAEIDQARADLAKHGPATLPAAPIDRRAGMRRGLVWSALAIAATIVVVVMQPPEQNQAGSDVAKAKQAPAAAPQRLDEPAMKLRQLDDSVAGDAADEHLAEMKQESTELPPGLRAQMSAPALRAAESSTLASEEAEAVAASAPASAPSDSLSLGTHDAKLALGVEFDLDGAVPAADAPATLAAPMSAGAPISGAMGGGGFGGERGDAALLKAIAQQPDAKAAGVTVTLQLANQEGAAWFRELLAKNDVTPVPGPQVGVDVRLRRGVSGPTGRTTVTEKLDAAREKSAADAVATRDYAHFYGRGLPLEGAQQFHQDEASGQAVWVEASQDQLDHLLAACGDDRTKVTAINVVVDATLSGASRRLAADRLPAQLQVDGGKPAGEASSADALAKSSSGQPAEAAAEDPRVRVLFVLQSPRVEAATPAAPGAVAPAITPATTGEAR